MEGLLSERCNAHSAERAAVGRSKSAVAARRNGTRVKLDVALLAIRDVAGQLVGISAVMGEVQ
jgi:hypothetical protein